jgi:DNA ligase (NAD+)
MLPTQFLQKLKSLSKESIIDIHGVGDVIAQNIIDFYNSPRYDKMQEEFTKLESADKSPIISVKAKEIKSGPLLGEVICITGIFEIPRPQIKVKLEELGATVVDNITKKTTILLAGQDAGSKEAKAKKAGIRIIINLPEILDLSNVPTPSTLF